MDKVNLDEKLTTRNTGNLAHAELTAPAGVHI